MRVRVAYPARETGAGMAGRVAAADRGDDAEDVRRNDAGVRLGPGPADNGVGLSKRAEEGEGEGGRDAVGV